MRKYSFITVLLAILGVLSCSTDPKLEDNEEVGIYDALSMTQFIAGAYHEMTNFNYMGRNLIIAGEVRSDNCYANGNSTRFLETSRMTLGYTSETDFEVGLMFGHIYRPIALANIIINTNIDGLLANAVNNPSDVEDINHTVGEAYALRALAHFDLLRLYGQLYLDPSLVPNLPSPKLGISYKKAYKPEESEAIARGTVEENKANIYADIEQAISYFQNGTGSSRSSQKTNLTLDATYVLLTRVGVYFGEQNDYQMVKEAAENLLGKYPVTPASEYVSYWKQSTPGSESIFELAQSTSDNQGGDGLSQIYRGTAYGDIVPFPTIFQEANFEDNDVRRSDEMIGPEQAGGPLRNMGKYPASGTELGSDNIKIFRYSEVILNYAEALYKLNDPNALDYLNEIPSHRNASLYAQIDMDKILEERRKEFIFEGFRFFDLARTGRAIDSPDKNVAVPNPNPLPWGSYNYALPIPRAEMDANNLTTQNPNYGS